MFDFFVKKHFLADHLRNFVDMHNHILPGIDDGAKTSEESLELIEKFGELGISKFIATPHIMYEYYDNDRNTITASLDSLRSALLKEKMKNISIEASAEHMIDNNYLKLLEEGGVMPMRKDYLLLEMSYLQPSINFDEAIIKTAEKGYFPILAHPERYVFLFRRLDKFRKLKEQGILFQLNLLSLGDYYGKEVSNNTRRILEAGLFDFIATDVHNLAQIKAVKELSLPKKEIKQLIPIIQNTIETFY